MFIQVALPVPLPRLFSYLPCNGEIPVIGGRVRVPFGQGHQIGIVVATNEQCDIAVDKLKPIIEILDKQSLFSSELWQLAHNAARYYFAPLGLVLPQLLPVKLRKGESAQPAAQRYWQLTQAGQKIDPIQLKKAPQQAKIITQLLAFSLLADSDISQLGCSRPALNALNNKGLVVDFEQTPQLNQGWPNTWVTADHSPTLNKEQAIAVATINQATGFQSFLIDGVTGSGKTEVYLNIMEPLLKQGRSILVLVPEIGLTPQTIRRFQRRFPLPIEVLHSAVNDTQRLASWQQAKAGGAAIVLGTRSALFTDMPTLGMIIIDEEHDPSFKQQEGFRYHGRDLAVMRAQLHQIPIVLGSATPSLESLANVERGRYCHLQLTQRAGSGRPVKQLLQDIRNVPLDAGMSPAMIERMRHHLQQGNQVMLFLNRRGFAPALLCHECGHLHHCRHCDAFYTVHQAANLIQCHHCGSAQGIPRQCPDCGSTQLFTRGVGTEQLAQALARLFPQYQTIRIDRDSTSRKGSLDNMLEQIRNNEVQILVGTQMLAKGHHFPDVTFVGLLDVDSALFSADFRATEHLAQLYIQVSGRAGRASKAGEVMLQTHQPEHPLLHQLMASGYAGFAQEALLERRLAHLPPYWQLAILRAEATYPEQAKGFIQQAKAQLPKGQVQLIGPMPAPLERKANRFRFQALLLAPNRLALQEAVTPWLATLNQLESGRKCRWQLERDPHDLM
ncbi:MAG: primosomal protein N' [Ferrimonas sp.]